MKSKGAKSFVTSAGTTGGSILTGLAKGKGGLMSENAPFRPLILKHLQMLNNRAAVVTQPQLKMGINHLTIRAMNKATSEPTSKSHECLEWPECHEGLESLKCPEVHVSPKFPESPVSPVSEGQELERQLKALAACNACNQLNTARPRRFKLARDLKALQKKIGR